MKTFRINCAIPAGFSLIRRFGRAALLADRRGHWRLVGGHRTERWEAREWASLFCHEALISTTGNEEAVADTNRVAAGPLCGSVKSGAS